MDIMGWACGTPGIVGKKPEGKGTRGTPRPNWEGNSKMDLKRNRMGECGVD